MDVIFQSTPPHGERLASPFESTYTLNFNPRPPHGERRITETEVRVSPKISIHAPRMGSDVSCECISARQAYFNPRSRMGSDCSALF